MLKYTYKLHRRTYMFDLEVFISFIADGKTNGWLARYYDVSKTTIQRWCKKYNIESTRNVKIHELDASYFDYIDNEKKAYILGFLMADGYNEETRGRIALHLSIRDIDILEKIRLELKSSHPIRIKTSNHGKEVCMFEVGSKRLSMSLANLGCTATKSIDCKIPRIYKHLIKYFIRGYFDGDGGIHIRKDNNQPSVSIAGTTSFLEQLQHNLPEDIDTYIRDRESVAEMCIYCANAKKFLDWIYKDANIYLDRKYALYKTIVE